MKKVKIYCDGACTDRNGGYASVLVYEGKTKVYRKEVSGSCENATCYRMELMAIIAGISELKESCYVELYSDNKTIVDSIVHGYNRNANHDLWNAIDRLKQKHRIQWNWVRRNSLSEMKKCDELAKNAKHKS